MKLFNSRIPDRLKWVLYIGGGGESNERPFRRFVVEDASSASVIARLTSLHRSLSLSLPPCSRFLSDPFGPTRSLGSASLTDKCAADGQIGIYGGDATAPEMTAKKALMVTNRY